MTPTEGDPIDRLYQATATPQLVRVPPLTFLCIDGYGNPNTSPAYAGAVQALYSLSYAAKSAVRKAGGPVLQVSFLKGLWWSPDPNVFLTGVASDWEWTLMVRQPEAFTRELCARLIDEVAGKKSVPVTRRLRLVSFEEGAAAQVLHVGPYATEAPTIKQLHEFIHDRGFRFDGHRDKHHEIYLSDPRRSAPERLRTIIRQPNAAS